MDYVKHNPLKIGLVTASVISCSLLAAYLIKRSRRSDDDEEEDDDELMSTYPDTDEDD